MMFRRSLINLVFPEDDEVFRLHMDFYVVVMAQMVAGSLLIDEALYSYRLHGRNGAADNPVLGGRLHLSSRNWGDTHGRMLDRMLTAMSRDRESVEKVLERVEAGDEMQHALVQPQPRRRDTCTFVHLHQAAAAQRLICWRWRKRPARDRTSPCPPCRQGRWRPCARDSALLPANGWPLAKAMWRCWNGSRRDGTDELAGRGGGGHRHPAGGLQT